MSTIVAAVFLAIMFAEVAALLWLLLLVIADEIRRDRDRKDRLRNLTEIHDRRP